ncbi:MAG: hypothetical protein WCX46_04405, partial [Candidatus Paceibacterota bacterium]
MDILSIVSGKVRGINTSTFTPGDTVYLSASTAGSFNSTRPTQPNFTALIGKITESDPIDGSIYVNISSTINFGNYTNGAIAFGGSDGIIKEDNTNLFWENASNRLGIGTNNPTKTLTIGNGLGTATFTVEGSSGNITTSGALGVNGGIINTSGALTINSSGTNALTLDSTSTGTINLGTGAFSKAINIGNTTSGSILNLNSGTGNINLQAGGTGTIAKIQIGAGGLGSNTPDLFALDVKSTDGDPDGYNGAMYYNEFLGEFRCYEDGDWMDCDGASYHDSLQQAYETGQTINLNSGDLSISGAGAVNLNPTATSSFTSAGALTLDAGTTLNLGTSNATAISLGKSDNVVTLNGSMTVPNYVDFTSTSNPTYSEGRLFYDDEVKSLAYYNNSADVTVNIGQENLIRVHNNSGSNILNGQVVQVNGSINGSINLPTVGLAIANDFDLAHVSGVATQDIDDGESGFITNFGIIHDVNTSSFAEGSDIYLSSTIPGGITSTMPAYPNFVVYLGSAVESDAILGSILIQNIRFANTVRKLDTGSLSFSGTDGLLMQDNTNLFWDNSTKRLGIGDNTPAKTFTIGNGTPGSNMLGIDGSNGTLTTQGDINLTTGGGSITASGGGLAISAAGASSLSTTTGALTLSSAGTGTGDIKIGTGGAGSTTPDLFALDVKSTTGDPAGYEGAMYYNTFTNRFRCYQESDWKDCD